tara:strand:+ start:686 stop:1102 length:417 start_codon:yes stop_codon:yes gene_type:complete
MNEANYITKFNWWFSLVLFLLIWPMFVGPYIAFTNPTFFGGPDVSEMTLSSTLYVARNLAVGLSFLIAIYLRNSPMLFILIVIRLVTDLIDAPAFYIFNESNLIGLIIIFILLCYLPAIIGLRYLWKQMKLNNSGNVI